MTTKTEALKLALEALMEHGTAYLGHSKEYQQAITKGKEALAQPAEQPACSGCGKTNSADSQWACYCVDCWSQTRPEQEPVAYLPGVLTNFCSRCGKRLGTEADVHTCTPPQPTGWDNGLSQDYDKKLGAWFSEKPNAKQELRARTFDDYGNKIV
jgi:hypothetical protein